MPSRRRGRAGHRAAVALLSRSRSFFIAGLVPLFPTFALIAHYIVGTERSGADLRTTALFGLWSLIPYAVYLFSCSGRAPALRSRRPC
jgi:membrane protein GlpM